MLEIEGTQKFWQADVVFLAMGFVGGEDNALFDELGITITDRNTIAVNENKQTSVEKVFAAGDCERGQSLIVWAIADGRKAAAGVHKFLLEQPEPALILSAQS
jgi:NADPH-dependent glutamate synthase beta subunit-like oxidoreductase